MSEINDNSTVTMEAYEFYLAMQTFGWIAVGNRKDLGNEAAEIASVANRQYWRMRQMTGEDTFWKMRAAFEGQTKPRSQIPVDSPRTDDKPTTN